MSYNDTNLGDPHETPEEKIITILEGKVDRLQKQLSEAERGKESLHQTIERMKRQAELSKPSPAFTAMRDVLEESLYITFWTTHQIEGWVKHKKNALSLAETEHPAK